MSFKNIVTIKDATENAFIKMTHKHCEDNNLCPENDFLRDRNTVGLIGYVGGYLKDQTGSKRKRFYNEYKNSRYSNNSTFGFKKQILSCL